MLALALRRPLRGHDHDAPSPARLSETRSSAAHDSHAAHKTGTSSDTKKRPRSAPRQRRQKGQKGQKAKGTERKARGCPMVSGGCLRTNEEVHKEHDVVKPIGGVLLGLGVLVVHDRVVPGGGQQPPLGHLETDHLLLGLQPYHPIDQPSVQALFAARIVSDPCVLREASKEERDNVGRRRERQRGTHAHAHARTHTAKERERGASSVVCRYG